MAEKVEIVIAGDCMGDGETFLRGERRTVSKETHRQLIAAGRVCKSDEEEEAAEADLARRKPEEKPERSKGKAKEGGENTPPPPPPGA